MIEKTGTTVAAVTYAIERASTRTGMDFDYLMKTAIRESSLDPNAKAGTSSASGLFQFIEQTWLGMIKKHGAEHGLGDLADQISQTKSGRYTVADRQVRRDILALRFDPEIAATMAGEFTKESQQILSKSLGRAPTGGELYAAHFLGSAGAVDLIQAAQRGEASAAALFPDAARANRSIFYAKGGVPRSAAQVMAVLESKHNNVDLPEAPAVADGVMLAKLRPTVSTMDDVVAPEYAPVLAGRPYMPEDTTLASDTVTYTASAPSAVMSPFMAQLLASLDPIPERVRDALYRADLGAVSAEDRAA